MSLTFGSLFAGIGGIDLGFERAGLTCKWQVEKDEACQKVLAKHWPGVPRYGDITTVDFTELEPVDVLAGGFPCQPVSVAGRRRGQDDERWLWPEFQRAIAETRPRFVVIENVRGLRTKGLDVVLEGLASLRYDAEWQVVSAASVGAPHLRERLVIVAYPPRDRRGQGWSWRSPGEGADGAAIREKILADAYNGGRLRWSGNLWTARRGEPAHGGWWATEPDVGRVATRVPGRVDRLKQLGNAVVPQVAEFVGRLLVEAAA